MLNRRHFVLLPWLLSAFLLATGTVFAQSGIPFPFNEEEPNTDSYITEAPFLGLREQPPHRNTFFQSVTAEQSLSTGGGGPESVGNVHAEAKAMFALPCPGGGNFLLTPSFLVDHFYELPDTLEMEKTLYRTGLTLSWMKDFRDDLRVVVFVSPMYMGDFKNSGDNVRVPGGGWVVWTPSPNWQFSLGAYYTAINGWLVMPIAGVTWQPNEDWKFDFAFPNPRISHRITPTNPRFSPFWLSVAGELFGGSWATLVNGQEDTATFREYRILFSIHRDRPKIGEIDARLEVGFSFYRSLYFDDRPTEYQPGVGFVERFYLSF